MATPHDRFHPYRNSDRPSTSTSRNVHEPGIIHPPLNAPIAPAPVPVQRPAAATPPHPLQISLDRIIGGVSDISHTVTTMQLEQQRMAGQLNELLQSSFSIEKSGYKVWSKVIIS